MESDQNNLIDTSDIEPVPGNEIPCIQLQSKKLNFKLEPALLLLMFGWNLSGTVTQNQIIKQTCLYTYGFNETICNQLGGRNESDDIKVSFYWIRSSRTLTFKRRIFIVL